MREMYESQHQTVPSPILSAMNDITSHDSNNDSNHPLPDPGDFEQLPAPDDSESVVHVPNEKVQRYVLNEVRLKLEHGHSISVTEDHLRNTADMLGGNQIPTKWNEVLRLMKTLGYCNPQHYKVCASQDHSFLLTDKATYPKCPKCDKPWCECIDYYCLGLNFRDWFLTEEYCQQLMAHWRDRDEWLSGTAEHTHVAQTELWHGDRFKELSWFWNPEKEYTLPELCPHCNAIIPSAVVEEASTSTPTVLKCKRCNKEFVCYQRTVRGDPRNQAIVIHEDGWCSFSTSSKSSIAAITITHGCMSKADRSESDNARVYSFIPVSQLPNDAPHKYDAFFQPLFREIEDLFIEGEQVFFKTAVPGFSDADDFPTLRVVPLLTTADSKAHHEIGLTSAGGVKGCRRCTVSGEYVAERRHYYFGQFQYRFWNPCPPRTAEQDRRNGQAADCAITAAERKRILKETGVTGESSFFRLYDLCGFDPVKDLVIDAMHAIVLNLIRTELESRLLADLALNASLPATERDPKKGGVLSRADLIRAMQRVEWTTEMKDGRVPVITPDSQKLGHWKAEEFSKFVVIAPVILRGIIPRRSYECFCLLTEIHKLVFSKSLRVQGWCEEHRTYFKQLLWSHAILYEELYGIGACSENVEYSLHMPEDVDRHSTMDNYWCYLYERQVKYYKQQTSNMKSLCKTFADRASQLHFVTTFQATHPSALQECTFNLEQISQQPVFLSASSFEAAINLKEYLTSCEPLPPDVKRSLSSGIMLGKPSYKQLTEHEINDIRFWLREFELDQDLPNVCQTYARVVKNTDYDIATVYRTGEYVVVRDAQTEEKEWLVQLTDIIVYGPIGNLFHYYLNGTYYSAKTSRGAIEYDTWTGEPKMIRREYRRLCLTPLHFIDRKVMVYKLDNESSCLMIDMDGPVVCRTVGIPYYPNPGEVVKVKTNGHLLVETVNNQTVQGHELRRVNGTNPRWIVTRQCTEVALRNIVCVVPHHVGVGCVYFD